MTLEEILASGDRVEFKRYISECSYSDLATTWIRATARPVQDFERLALMEMHRRERTSPL